MFLPYRSNIKCLKLAAPQVLMQICYQQETIENTIKKIQQTKRLKGTGTSELYNFYARELTVGGNYLCGLKYGIILTCMPWKWELFIFVPFCTNLCYNMLNRLHVSTNCQEEFLLSIEYVYKIFV